MFNYVCVFIKLLQALLIMNKCLNYIYSDVSIQILMRIKYLHIFNMVYSISVFISVLVLQYSSSDVIVGDFTDLSHDNLKETVKERLNDSAEVNPGIIYIFIVKIIY